MLPQDQDSIFAVPVRGDWLLHAPLHSVTAFINTSALAHLAALRTAELPEALKVLSAELAQPPRSAPAPPEGDAQPEFVGLITTRACNLGCVYCGFGAHSAGAHSMPLSTAVAAVDWMAERASATGRETLDVHFFGGEPLCAPEVVDVAVHRARARAAERGLKPRFEMATNGCFDRERCRFLGDYFDTLVLSVDGPPPWQDVYRPSRSGTSTYERVVENARALAASRVELSVRVTVTSATVGRLAEIADTLCRVIHPASIVFEPLRATQRSNEAGLAPPAPCDFVPACLEAFGVARTLGVRPIYAPATIDDLRHSFCPVGRDTAIVSPDGRVSACYMLAEDWEARGLDLALGAVQPDGTLALARPALERVRALTTHGERCRRCLARWHCAGGCHVSQSPAERSTPGNAFCTTARLMSACALLERLGQADEARRLATDRVAFEALAFRASDRLRDFGKGDA